eukprot:TRINITY_DN2004_c0_g1_i7.p2 TRINITY_DN2004_c0_g1~~TRINITY_DN2004_c0_g1_i7.p2  ORF type:complete len:123 (-),score=7.42 TRINITY_DN2004_c0_g1_i7:1724-2092(-)
MRAERRGKEQRCIWLKGAFGDSPFLLNQAVVILSVFLFSCLICCRCFLYVFDSRIACLYLGQRDCDKLLLMVSDGLNVAHLHRGDESFFVHKKKQSEIREVNKNIHFFLPFLYVSLFFTFRR